MAQDDESGWIMVIGIWLFVAYLSSSWPFKKDEETELYKKGFAAGKDEGWEDGHDQMCNRIKYLSENFYQYLIESRDCP